MATSPGGAGLDGAQPALTVAAVARMLGVAPATLRTWDRRYQVGPEVHESGAHRRYTSTDISRLMLMRRMIAAGVTPAEAGRIARSMSGEQLNADDPRSRSLVTPGDSDVRQGGGRVIRLPAAPPATRGLARAVLALDAAACTEIIGTGIRERGIVATWESLLVPVLISIGDRWESTHLGVDREHLLSECALACFHSAVQAKRPPAPTPPVLLACAEEEQHSLPIHALAAALAERGIAARTLGGRVPSAALSAAVRLIGPAVVFLWSSLAATGHVDQLAALPHQRPSLTLILGGPGWDLGRVPADVFVAQDLTGAVEYTLNGLDGIRGDR